MIQSIKGRMITWILPGVLVLYFIGATGVYFSEKTSSESQVELRVRDMEAASRGFFFRLGGIRSRDFVAAGRNSIPYLERPEFAEKSSNEIFQIWEPDGTTSSKSINLGNETIVIAENDFQRPGVILRTELSSGQRVLVWAAHLFEGRMGFEKKVAVGMSYVAVDHRLYVLLWQLGIGGAICSVVVAVLLVVALNTSLKPLRRLGDQAANLDVHSLNNRFPVLGMPSEVQPIVHRLNDLVERLEQGFSKERRFSGNLAHELRTPLAAIRSTSEVAVNWPEKASQDEFKRIAETAANMQTTVDSLLMLTRLDSQALRINHTPVDLESIIDDGVALRKELIDARRLQVDVDVGERKLLQSDPNLIGLIVSNIVGNATEYAPEGSLISINLYSGEHLIEVWNSAPNLSDSDVANLFERLWKGDVARTDDSHAGLGLSIAKSCAEVLGLQLLARFKSSKGLLGLVLRT